MSQSKGLRPYPPQNWASYSGLSSSGSDSDEVDTPLTGRSVFFEDVVEITATVRRSGYILVVGGLGYIGSHTVWELAKAGFNVVVVDNLSNSFRSVFERIGLMVDQHYEANGKLQNKPSLKFHEADFRDMKAMTAVLQAYHAPLGTIGSDSENNQESSITGVIHFAAYKAVGESLKLPLKYYSNNVGGLIDFLALLNDFGIRNLVFSSSATVYGSVADQGYPLREEHCSQNKSIFIDSDGSEKTVEPGCSGLTNPYGRTKWMCEAILSDLCCSDPAWNVTALRYFNPVGCDESGLLGEDPRGKASNLMPVVLRVMSGEIPTLSIYGDDYDTPDGTAVRDYIHVTDLARGHLAALKSSRSSGFQVYNLGCGRGYSVLEVVSAMEAASGQKIPTQLVGRREGDVGVCVAKPDKAELELGWKAEKNLETCCQDIWRFLELGKEVMA